MLEEAKAIDASAEELKGQLVRIVEASNPAGSVSGDGTEKEARERKPRTAA